MSVCTFSKGGIMRIFFVVNGVVYYVTYEDLAEYVANLRATKVSQNVDEGEFRCVRFHGGTEASSIFIIREQEDIQQMEILAAENDAQIVWYAVQLFDPRLLFAHGQPCV